MVLAVQVILVALMAEHAHRLTLTLLVAQPLKRLIALVEWHHRQHHHRDQPHHVQSHLQRLLLQHHHLFLRHQLLLPLQLPLQCPVGEVAQSVATRYAPMEITALDLSAVWMVQLAHLRQTLLTLVSCPSHLTALDDHHLQRSSPFGISMTSAQA